MKDKAPKLSASVITSAISLVALLILVTQSCTIVPAGHKGVAEQFGQVYPNEYQEGMHGHWPWVNIHNMSYQVDDYTMAAATEEGQRRGNDAVTALSLEGLTLTADVSVQYRRNPDQLDQIFKYVGQSEEAIELKMIRPVLRDAIRTSIGKFRAEEAATSGRDKVSQAIFDEAQRRLNTLLRNSPGELEGAILIAGVQLREVALPTEIVQAINRKQQAEQEAAAETYKLDGAKVRAQSLIAEAEGKAEAAKLEAQALKAQGGELVIAREWIQKWDGKLPAVSGSGDNMLIDITELSKQKAAAQ